MTEEIKELRYQTNLKLVRLQAARLAVRKERTALAVAQTLRDDLRKALTICQAVAQSVQEAAHAKIATIVSRSLEVVFDTPYKFQIKFELKRGRTEARLVFERDGLEVDPLTASGGGVVSVASFALRLSCLMITQPPFRRLLVLDEPFSHLSVEFRPRLVELVLALAKELEIQFLIVTHENQFRAGKVIELWLRK